MLLCTIVTPLSWAAKYTLPSGASKLPGGYCSVSGNDVNCSGNLIFGNNDSIVLKQPIRLNISGDFTFGNGFEVNASGQASDMNIVVAGNLKPGNNAIINANLTVSGSVNSVNNDNNATTTGNIVVSGNLNLGNNSTVIGNITASTINIDGNANITGNLTAQNINVGNNVTVTGNIKTNNININGNNTVIDGNINATGSVNNNGTVTGYVNANQVNDNGNGIDDDKQCDLDGPDGPNSGPCTPSIAVDHYQLSFAGTGYTCGQSSVQISACANNSCSSLVNQQTSLTLTHSSGTLSNSNLSFTGSTSVNLSKSTSGQVLLGINNANPSPSSALTCIVNGSQNTCQVEFIEGGLSVSWGTTNTITTIPNQASQQLMATDIVVSNNADASCAANLSGKTLQVAIDCSQPANCNSNMLQLGGSTINNPQSFINSGLTFNANGQAVIPANTLRYDDAGKIKLLVKDSADLASGSSNEFVVVPTLKVVADIQAVNVAGINFGLSMLAIGAQGIITPNYQPSQLKALVHKITPDAGRQGQLVFSNTQVTGESFVASVNNGETTYTLVTNSLFNMNLGQSVYLQAYYSEAGSIDLQMIDDNYFGQTVAANNVASIGRFTPAYLGVSSSSPKLINTCTSGANQFSYTGQRVELDDHPMLTIVAKNALGENIQNYIDGVQKLTPDNVEAGDIVFADTSTFSQMPEVDPSVVNSQQTSVGDLEVFIKPVDDTTMAPIGITYPKLAMPSIPFEGRIQIDFSAAYLTDSDGVCYETDYAPDKVADCQIFSIKNIDGANMRYGRLVMENAYGPETEPLSLSMMTQYYNDSAKWAIHTDDSCTVFDAADTQLDEVHSQYEPTDIPTRSGSGTFSAGKSTSLSDSITIASPGEGNQLEFPLLLEQPDYLFFDWDGDGTIQPPSAIITFGQYRGNDRIINWREVFN